MENQGYKPDSTEDKSSMQVADPEIKVDLDQHAYLEVENLEEKRPLATEPYAGMGKEDLLRFSETPFWKRMRLAFLIIFWLAWLALLVTVIVLTIVLPRCQAAPSQLWWQKSVLYQVYVRSFYDSDGDGIGDLNGVTAKLDYIKDIGASGVILSSIYQSQTGGTNPDHGYEVTNHKAVHPEYGTLADLDTLIQRAHARGLKVVLPFIPNHTGTQHPWFVQSSTGSGDKLNFYVWHDCTPGTNYPNNWRSVYSESAWENNVNRTQCYLHQLLKSQADLNLRSALVREELESILRFWLDRGVDGFRVDSATFLFEDADLRDDTYVTSCGNTADYACYDHLHTRNQSEIHDLITRWRTLIDEYSTNTGNHRVLLTDAVEDAWGSLAYYDRYGRTGAHLPLNYQLTSAHLARDCDSICTGRLADSWVYSLPQNSTANWMTGTQDIHRMASKLGTGYVNAVHMLTMTLPGVPVVYYGDEIGMLDGPNNNMDPVSSFNTSWSRDPYRQPMHWSNTTDAGFVNGSGTPWLTVDGYMNNNVETLNSSSAASNSSFKFFRAMAQLHQDAAFLYGHMHYVTVQPGALAYIREYDGSTRYLVALNFGPNRTEVEYSKAHYMIPEWAEAVLNTHRHFSAGTEVYLGRIGLMPGEGVIFKWSYTR